MNRSLRLLSFMTFFAAVALFVLLAPEAAAIPWPQLVVLVLMALVTENFAFDLPVGGSVSLSFAAIYAALLFAGPFAAVLCALAASTTVRELHGHPPVELVLFNIGQASLAAGVGGLVYIHSGGQVLFSSPSPSILSVPAALGAAVAFYIVNVLLVGAFVAVRKSQSLPQVLRSQRFLSYALSLFVLALLGLAIAAQLAVGSWLGLLLLVLPFMAARRTFRVYAELSEAYTSTVRSLVTAIEAKDPYTKGHSERVAVYAAGLAEALGLPRVQVDLVERAALLHDVGKIGIPLDTLTSPAQLSSEEVRLIRQHPDVGSRLVSDVEFLSDIVPVIRHHHERVDGAGYPDGLIGEDIPALSRVLAVADAYDAMTSNRAYRLAMSRDAATAEIMRVSGKQLDRVMAEKFIGLLDRRAFEVVQDV